MFWWPNLSHFELNRGTKRIGYSSSLKTPVSLMDGRNLLYSGDDVSERARCEKWEKDCSHTMASFSLNWEEKYPLSHADIVNLIVGS